jgi:uncharacterized membrane protein
MATAPRARLAARVDRATTRRAVTPRRRRRAPRHRARALAPAASAFAVPFAVLAAASLGRVVASRTRVGRAATAPVCAMAFGAAFAAIGALPSGGARGVAEMQKMCAFAATPMTLLRANARAGGTRRRTRAMARAFVVAAIGSAFGAVFGARGASAAFGGAFSWKLAAALAAKNVGGGLNYVAVATTLGMDGEEFVAGLCVDNAMALAYFPFISWLARREGERGSGDAADDAEREREATTEREAEDADGAAARSGADDALSAFFVAVGFLAAGELVARLVGQPDAVLPMATVFTVVFATLAPKRAASLAVAAEPLANAMLFVFFVAAGAAGGVLSASTFARYANVFVFSFILYAVHLAFVFVGIRVDADRRREYVLASNASIGGPATVASLADAVGWRSLRAPAVLIATLANSIATFLGLALAAVLRSS